VADNSSDDARRRQRDSFFYPQGRYRGEFTPENLAFNANLQEFAQRVAIICSLETGGKITPDEAYAQIRELWAQLEESKENLLDDGDVLPPELPPE
jgi:hypothetical protein